MVLVTSNFAYSAFSIRNAKSNCNVVSDKSRSYFQCFEDMTFSALKTWLSGKDFGKKQRCLCYIL